MSTAAETKIYPIEIAEPNDAVALYVVPSKNIGVIEFELTSLIFKIFCSFNPLKIAYSLAFFLAFSNAARLACFFDNLVSFCEKVKPVTLTPLINEN